MIQIKLDKVLSTFHYFLINQKIIISSKSNKLIENFVAIPRAVQWSNSAKSKLFWDETKQNALLSKLFIIEIFVYQNICFVLYQ